MKKWGFWTCPKKFPPICHTRPFGDNSKMDLWRGRLPLLRRRSACYRRVLRRPSGRGAHGFVCSLVQEGAGNERGRKTSRNLCARRRKELVRSSRRTWALHRRRSGPGANSAQPASRSSVPAILREMSWSGRHRQRGPRPVSQDSGLHQDPVANGSKQPPVAGQHPRRQGHDDAAVRRPPQQQADFGPGGLRPGL